MEASFSKSIKIKSVVRENSKQEFGKGCKIPNEIFEMQKNIIELISNCELENEIQTNLLKTTLSMSRYSKFKAVTNERRNQRHGILTRDSQMARTTHITSAPTHAEEVIRCTTGNALPAVCFA